MIGRPAGSGTDDEPVAFALVKKTDAQSLKFPTPDHALNFFESEMWDRRMIQADRPTGVLWLIRVFKPLLR